MNGPLHIAMFVGSFPAISETFILRQIKGLLERGHEVDIYADTRGEMNGPLHTEVSDCRLLEHTTFMDMPEAAAPWELPVRPLAGRTWTPGASKPVFNCLRVLQAVPHAVRCFATTPRLARQVLDRAQYGFQADSLSALFRLSSLTRRRCRYDVLHAHFGPIGNSFRFARELWQAPLLVSFHGYDFCTLPRQQGLDMYRQLFDTADLVTVNSEFTRRRVMALGCHPEKLREMRVGLELGRFPFRERHPRSDSEPVRLITVARLIELKGHEFALRAVALLHQKHRNLSYDIVGDGPLRSQLERLSADLGLQGVIRWHGARDGTFIEDLMAQAHIAILASVSIEGDAEGQGLFVQEAQACGLPVVVTQHGALPEGLVPDRSGFVVPERDPKRLAERLDYLMENPERWAEMGRTGMLFVASRYDIRQLTGQLVELYHSARDAFRNARQT